MLPIIINLDETRGTNTTLAPKRKRPPSWNTFPLIATIIAIDPGGTTGWSLMHVDPMALLPSNDIRVLDSIQEWQHGQVDCGSTKGNLATSPYAGISTHGESAGANVLSGLIRTWPGAAVVVESFQLRQFSRDQDLLSPQRVTSKLEQDLWLNSREYFTQTPSEGKVSATDVRLREWGLYDKRGGLQHARDADRHAITFLRRCCQPGRKAQDLREAAWPHLFQMGRPYGSSLPPRRLEMAEETA